MPTPVQFLTRNLWFILLVTLIAGAGAYFFSHRSKISYTGSETITVQSSRTFPKPGEGAALYRDSISEAVQVGMATTQAWLNDPLLASKSLQAAGLNVDQIPLKDLTTVFRTSPPLLNSNQLQVKYSADDQDQIAKVFAALKENLLGVDAQYNKTSPDLTINLLFADPLVTTDAPSSALVPLIGAVAGFILALVIMAIVDRKRD